MAKPTPQCVADLDDLAQLAARVDEYAQWPNRLIAPLVPSDLVGLFSSHSPWAVGRGQGTSLGPYPDGIRRHKNEILAHPGFKFLDIRPPFRAALSKFEKQQASPFQDLRAFAAFVEIVARFFPLVLGNAYERSFARVPTRKARQSALKAVDALLRAQTQGVSLERYLPRARFPPGWLSDIKSALVESLDSGARVQSGRQRGPRMLTLIVAKAIHDKFGSAPTTLITSIGELFGYTSKRLSEDLPVLRKEWKREMDAEQAALRARVDIALAVPNSKSPTRSSRSH